MARAVRFYEFGSPDVLKIEECDVGEPGQGEMRVRIEAIGLNRAEAAFRSGSYIEKAKLPARLGYEAAGIIEAMGAGVSGFAVGDSICVIPAFSMNQYGVYAEKAIVPASAVLKRPPGISSVEAAAIWMPYLTAYGALIDICRIGKGQAAVITAASSSVGIAAIQIVNSVGGISIAATRTRAKKQGLLDAGATHVIVTDEQNLAEEVMRITAGVGARMVFDPVGGPGVLKLVPAMAAGGSIVLYGNLSGEAHSTPFPFGPAVGRGLSMRGYLVFEIIHDPARFAPACAFILNGLLSGEFKPKIAKTFPFEQIVAAHRYLEGNEQLGKVVVTVP